MALILDTGPLFAAIDRGDSSHLVSRDLLAASQETLLIPAPVLVEVDQLTSSRRVPSGFDNLLQDILAGVFVVEDLHTSDFDRVADLMRRYADSDIGFVDAAVLAVVERLNEPKLATLDRRHFGVMRPRHVAALRLLPEMP